MGNLEEKKILGFEGLFDKFISLYLKKNLPNKLIISGQKGIGKSSFSKKFINFILSKNLTNDYDTMNNTPVFLNKYSNQNYFLIDVLDDKKIIDINQIRHLINRSQKKSLNDLPRFVLIDNVEKLNINASNALLKILEEPYENMYFILIHDNRIKLLETIKSRCLIYNIFFNFDKNLSIVNQIIETNIQKSINNRLLSPYQSISELLNFYNFGKTNNIDLNNINLSQLIKIIIDERKYKNDPNILSLCINLIEVMFYRNLILSKNIKFYDYYKYFSKKFFNVNKYNLDLETFFIEFKEKALYEK